LLAEKDDLHDLEYAWTARRYEPETIAIPFDDLKPPLFKINNRNWFVKVLGMLSHNWALIEENEDLTATVYFFQDEPPGKRPALIDSLNFEDENQVVNFGRMITMVRFDAKGYAVQEANGDFVLFNDVQELTSSTTEFVNNLLEQVAEGALSKQEALNALQVMFKLCLS
jgi:hypothetical protein